MVIKNVQVIVICVNYSDFLSITYRKNINFFERENYHVITTKEDSDTINLCEELKINYTFYNYFYKNSSFFNKSGAINNMQIKLHDKYPDDWILLLDADIILPNNFEEMYNSNCKDKTALYSLERKDYNTDSYSWGVGCETKNPGSGLIDLIIWISLYIFRKFQLRDLVNPNKFTTMEWAKRNNTYIVIYNLIRKSKYYKDLEYEKKVEALNNEILWYYEKFNFIRRDKIKLIKWFLDLEYSGLVDSIKISKLPNKKSLKFFQNIKDTEDYDSVSITQLYEYEDFSEKEALWKALSLRQLKLNIEKAENNLRLDYV
jgi:hypothetical protein